jgi:hypothetical protein
VVLAIVKWRALWVSEGDKSGVKKWVEYWCLKIDVEIGHI